ncbi:RNase H domain-containing protein [Caerostris extrusa]|uniref:RNase H domain-containing protein n=1 Tax=Caerostris extrusa TaxID=172846 RepID=A0AAV4NX51_CAEEX|nr:RNase H domain-containing protein [Caerostris extrusa]
MVKAWIAKLVDGSQYARSSLYTSNYKLAAWGFEHNVEMLRYYLQQCSTYEEKQRYLVKFARLTTYANIDVIRYAFPLMDSNTQELVLRRTPFITLRCFLDWPLQTVFMNVANRMWNYLSEEDFCVMLRYILFDRIFRESRDFNYVDLLKGVLVPKSHSFQRICMELA